MKRSPIIRKKSLASYSRAKGSRSGKTRVCAAEGCTNTFYAHPSRTQRYCSTRCVYRSRTERPPEERLARSAAMLGTRRGTANPNFRNGKRVGAHDRDRRRFRSYQTECQHPACPGTERRTNEHHVVYEQKVRRVGGDPYDGRNALLVCISCHMSHHRRGRRVIPLVALRDENYEFAVELLGAAAFDYLRRRYVGEDPRLQAVLDRFYR